MFISLIYNMLALQDFKIMVLHTLHDIIKIFVPEGAVRKQYTSSCDLTLSHWEEDMNKKETVVQQLAVTLVKLYSEKKKTQKTKKAE